jgi:formimidoylglutamate deiminase
MVAWVPDLLYASGRFERGLALVCGPDGRIARLAPVAEIEDGVEIIRLAGRAMLPGLVNAHSHAFQRVIRGRTEYRTGGRDTFWTWREMMYSAAQRLGPEEIYDASRMAFVEMALGGITAVGEFHYIHHAPDGAAYSDPNLLAKEVARAARDVGLRIAVLRVFYARSGHSTGPNAHQARFIEKDAGVYLRHVESLMSDLARAHADHGAWAGCAPHSLRAVPLDSVREIVRFARSGGLPLHMHIAEQPAEVAAVTAEYGRPPVALLAGEELLDQRLTAVHAVHVNSDEVRALARAGSIVCACPTTERNLGDGIVRADALFSAGARIALGTDSHTQIDLLEDARELEYHLRLQRLERAVLAPDAPGETTALAARLFDCATVTGAQSIGAQSGRLEANRWADFFTVARDDPSIAGAAPDDLLSAIIFSLSRTAVRDVAVGGRLIVAGGRHPAQDEIVSRFAALQRKLWG